MTIKPKWLYVVLLAALSFGLLALLSGCPENVTPSVDSLIGVWNGVFNNYGGESYTDDFELRADGTFTDIMGGIPPTTTSGTFSGTYIHNNAAKTITITVASTTNPTLAAAGYTNTINYTLSVDNNTITFSSSGGTGTYTRQ